MKSQSVAPPYELALVTRLASTPHGARAARHLALAQLTLWDLADADDLADSVATVIAELASNAARHAASTDGSFELCMLLARDRIRIEVTDSSPELRLPDLESTPSLDAVSGRGLLLVAACADSWGVHTGPDSKTVWAEFRRTPVTSTAHTGTTPP
jgi:anti-sigma regulatory factor (Ser/Thr protein kinase)